MKLKRKVVMLPTNEKATIGSIILNTNAGNQENSMIMCKTDIHVTNVNYIHEKSWKPQHLYFLSDEEIKAGDWCINSYDNTVWRYSPSPCPLPYWGNKKTLTKIIATTDKSLGLPQPSPEFIDKFIREYNKGNVITEVMVEYEEVENIKENLITKNILLAKSPYNNETNSDMSIYKQILKVDKNNYITITKVKDSWSREEVVTLCMKIQHETTKYKKSCHYGPNMRELAEWTNNWIEQNL